MKNVIFESLGPTLKEPKLEARSVTRLFLLDTIIVEGFKVDNEVVDCVSRTTL